MGELVTHPTRWKELQTFYLVNWAIFLLNIAACWSFVRSMVLLRDRGNDDATTAPALSHMALLLTSLALLFASFQRELLLSAVRADALLLFFLLLAASFLMRLQSGGRFVSYPLLGISTATVGRFISGERSTLRRDASPNEEANRLGSHGGELRGSV